MQKKFLEKTFMYICITFVICFCTIYWIQYQKSYSVGLEIINSKIKSLKGELQQDYYTLGKNGNIIIIKDGEILSSSYAGYKLTKDDVNKLIEISNEVDGGFSIEINKLNHIGVADSWNNYKIVGLLPKSEIYVSNNSMAGYLIMLSISLILMIFIIIYFLLKDIIISKIYNLNDSLQKIIDGDLNEKIEVRNVKEFQMLSSGINKTVDALKSAIENEVNKNNAELELAKSIQISTLPRNFPPYPEHCEFEIFARMDTAKEVGGDFYDFFFIDPTHLAFLVADVSGKGIPASLFMMRAKTLLSSFAKAGLTPARTLNKVNKQIYKSNKDGLFITIFYCVLELPTGLLTCVSAGHNPPILKAVNGDTKYLNMNPNIVIGVMPDIEFKSEVIQLERNDTILLYTDGVTEAESKDGKFFGNDKLLDIAEKDLFVKGDLEFSLNHIKSEVDTFSDGVEQTDDITLLALKYNGFASLAQEKSAVIKLDAVNDKYPNLISWLENLCEQLNMKNSSKLKLQIAVEEIFVNISTYAYPPKRGFVNIKFSIYSDDEIEMCFIDEGISYNPLENSNPDLTLSAEERPIGGLGIYIVKQTMDYTGYEFIDNQNIFTIRMKYEKEDK
ncbi:MAG: SpoIIE family protein phosphatase [Candidatus Gastranaerophilales bacterium]